ncbi:MAG: hypothetical protein KBH99_10500 [Syntrophobacteraceae bacterium]|nr:hypothetical protein [Syntrophobacteraceae bacterium]
MKKLKRPPALEEKEEAFSKELDLESEELDEEEVIELHDIVELPEDLEEDDTPEDFEVPLLDAEQGMDVSEPGGKIAESEEEDFFENDLLKEFALLEETSPEGQAESLIGGELSSEEEDLFDQISREETAVSEGGERGPDITGEAEVFPVEPEISKAAAEFPPDQATTGITAGLAAGMDAEALSSSAGSPEEINAVLDPLVHRIEERLIEMVHELVESRLPEIVRTLLQEEIERLRGHTH